MSHDPTSPKPLSTPGSIPLQVPVNIPLPAALNDPLPVIGNVPLPGSGDVSLPVSGTVSLPAVAKGHTSVPAKGPTPAPASGHVPPTGPTIRPTALDPAPLKFNRRKALIGGGAALAGILAYPLVRDLFRPNAGVFIARGQRYDGPLERTIADGLTAAGIDARSLAGKRVLLKPNLVEPNRKVPHMTTHPAMIVAAADVFRRWGAEVTVGEGPGHVRDTEMALIESGVQEELDSAALPFADLNYEEVLWAPNRGRASRLDGFYFPRSVIEADLIVSMPKMKTHHWVGFTAALKNLYGVIPGIKYGWPKNVLHHAGIPQTVFDINASLPKTVAIVDGITCMEGDGPILGSPKQMGLVIVGINPTAVDATIARIMGLDPAAVSYLQLAADTLGPIASRQINQLGERWEDVASPFRILDVPHLQQLRLPSGSLVS